MKNTFFLNGLISSNIFLNDNLNGKIILKTEIDEVEAEIESIISGTYGDTEDVVTAEGGGLGGWAAGLTNSLASAAESLKTVERGVSAAIDIWAEPR